MTRSETGPADPGGDKRLQPEYREILSRCLDRLNEDGLIDPEAILAEHPEFGAALLDDLRCFVDLRRSAAASDEPLGTVGDYTLRRQIGRGGMGLVYEAWENSMHRRVALKILPGGVAADSRSFLRFMHEARTAGQLNHPNIVAVYAMGVTEHTPYFAMEYVEGETLAQVIARQAKDPAGEAAPFGTRLPGSPFFSASAAAFAGVAEGLQHAHSKHVIHRDVKPSNLILDGEGRLRILDFGLARQEGQQTFTATGDVLGTVQYMSPEQVRGRKAVIDHRTDVYSLGAAMYEFYTGTLPFQGKDNQDTLSRILAREPAPPRKLKPDIPRDLETVILKCLSKDPADRFRTAEALGQDLRRFARGDAIEARPQSPFEKWARRAKRNALRLALGALTIVLAVLAPLFVQQYGAVRRSTAERTRAEALSAYRAALARAVSDIQLGQMSFHTTSGRKSGLDPVGLFEIYRFEELVRDSPLAPVQRAIETITHACPFPAGEYEGYYHWARALELRDEPEAALAKLDLLFEGMPDFAPGRMLAGRLHRAAGREDRAAEEEARAVRGAAAPWQQAWLAARAAEEEERWPEAADAYGRLLVELGTGALPYQGAHLETLVRRGQAFLRAKKLDAAARDFIIANATWPSAMEPLLFLGRTYLLMERPAYAREVFENLYAAASPDSRDHAAAWVAIAYTYHRRNEEALRWAEKIAAAVLRERLRSNYLTMLRRFEEAERAARVAVALDPDNAMARQTLALTLRGLRKYDEALQACREALRLEPEYYAHYHTMAMLHYERGEYAECNEFCEETLRRAPDLPETLACLGASLVCLGKVPEGLERLEKSYALKPAGLSATMLAVTLGMARPPGYVQRQLELYEKAVAHDPTLWLSWLNWGIALYQGQGNYEQAIGKLLKAEELHARDHTAFAHIACVYERLGDEPQAVRYYRKSLDLLRRDKRSDFTAMVQMANTLAHESTYPAIRDEGLRLFEEAAKTWPEEHRLLADYGAALYANDRFEEALRVTDRAVALEPGYVLAWSNRAAIDRRLGNRREAMADVVAALRAGSGSVDARTCANINELLFEERDHDFGDQLGELRTLLEHALVCEPQDVRLVWNEWLSLALAVERRGMADVQAAIEKLAAAAPPELERTKFYAREMLGVLNELRAEGVFRINCGGDTYRGADGAVWHADRFHHGGLAKAAHGAGAVPPDAAPYDIGGTDDDALYFTRREFPLWDAGLRSYRIPVLPGTYRVTLHLGETFESNWEPRKFTVKAKDGDVAREYDTRCLGAATADRLVFVVSPRDAVVEIVFEPVLAGAFVCALEVAAEKNE